MYCKQSKLIWANYISAINRMVTKCSCTSIQRILFWRFRAESWNIKVNWQASPPKSAINSEKRSTAVLNATPKRKQLMTKQENASITFRKHTENKTFKESAQLKLTTASFENRKKLIGCVNKRLCYLDCFCVT